MKRLTSTLGYSAAALTVVAAVLVPFLLYGLFAKGVVKLGLHVDEMYSGGPKLRTVQFSGYSVDVHRPVAPHMLQNESRFVQLDWKPVGALPARITDSVDVDGDGKVDVLVSFNVPRDPSAQLSADVDSLNPRYRSTSNMGKQKFSALIVRVDDAILVRVPLAD